MFFFSRLKCHVTLIFFYKNHQPQNLGKFKNPKDHAQAQGHMVGNFHLKNTLQKSKL